MRTRAVHQCQCPECLQEGDRANKRLHSEMNLLLSRLDEQQRRWYVALESRRIGRGGDSFLSVITGLDEKTIAKGRSELEASLEGCPTDRIRPPGAGRKPLEKKLLKR